MTPRGGATALALAILSATLPRGAAAQPVSLLSDSFFLAGQSAVLPDLAEAPGPASPGSGPSLFAGREGTSLFAARAPRAPERARGHSRARPVRCPRRYRPERGGRPACRTDSACDRLCRGRPHGL